jgi:hypothetical protein
MQFGQNPLRPGMQFGHSNLCLFFGMQFERTVKINLTHK